MALPFIQTTCDTIRAAIKAHEEKQESMRRRYESSTSTKNALYTLAMIAGTDEQASLVDSLKKSFEQSEAELEDIMNEFQSSEMLLTSQRKEIRESISELFRVYDAMSVALKQDPDPEMKNIMAATRDAPPVTQIREAFPDGKLVSFSCPDGFHGGEQVFASVPDDDFVPVPFGSDA
jgi:hypothetical protein